MATLVQESPKSEEALVCAFMEKLPSFLVGQSRKDDWAVATEFDSGHGRADLVAIHALCDREDLLGKDLGHLLAQPSKATLLTLLKLGVPRGEDYLVRATGYSRNAIRANLKELTEAGLTRITESRQAVLLRSLPWNSFEIIAFEAKLTNWRRALYQASRYRAFAHTAWVVMPESNVTMAKSNLDQFQAMNIGLISVPSAGEPTVLTRPRKKRPSSRRLHLSSIGKFLAELFSHDSDTDGVSEIS